jgi:hypothetical protein
VRTCPTMDRKVRRIVAAPRTPHTAQRMPLGGGVSTSGAGS